MNMNTTRSGAIPRAPFRTIAGSIAPAAALLALALVTYVLMNRIALGNLAMEIHARAIYKTLVYVLWIGCGFLALVGVVLTANRPVLAVLFAIVFISLTTNYAYTTITNSMLRPDAMEWMLHETGQFA